MKFKETTESLQEAYSSFWAVQGPLQSVLSYEMSKIKEYIVVQLYIIETCYHARPVEQTFILVINQSHFSDSQELWSKNGQSSWEISPQLPVLNTSQPISITLTFWKNFISGKSKLAQVEQSNTFVHHYL